MRGYAAPRQGLEQGRETQSAAIIGAARRPCPDLPHQKPAPPFWAGNMPTMPTMPAVARHFDAPGTVEGC